MTKNGEHQIIQIIKYTPPIVIILSSIIITLLIYFDYSKTLKTEKEKIQTNFINKQKSIIKQNVDIAIDYSNREFEKTTSKLKKQLVQKIHNAKVIMNSIYEKNKDTKSQEEITKLINDALREIRFNNGRGYFFIAQTDGLSILHPIFPEIEGNNLLDKYDPSGINLLDAVSAGLLKNEGYARYKFYHPIERTIQKEKIVYVEFFEPYNWIIGTGEYIQGFEVKIKKEIINHLTHTILGENRYYIILDDLGNLIAHNKKELLNENIYDNEKLKSFIPFFQVTKEEKLDETGVYKTLKGLDLNNSTDEKIYYIKKIPNLDWIILTGFDKESSKQEIIQNNKYLEEKYTKYLNTIIITSFLITLVLLLVSFYIARLIEKKFLSYKKELENKANENMKQKTMLEEAQKVAKIGDWEFNLKTNKAYWSQNVLELFGLPKDFDEAGPEFLKSIMHKDDWKGFEKSFFKSLRNHTEHKSIYRIYHTDMTIRWIECRGHYDNKKDTIIGIVQDITENKKLEEEKLQKEELLYQQSKMAAMGEMIGNIAHQWRQPLSSISTAATGIKLQKEMDILKDKDFDFAMNTINDKAQYLSQTIDDFRNFYKPNKENKHFYVDSMIEKTLNLLNAQFKSKNIEIVKSIENFELETFENELIQVVINLLNNSRDAFKRSRQSKNIIFIKTYDRDDAYFISIWDNAGGINKKILNRVFEPYFTTKHKAQGTGIGLYMSKEIITKHLDGEINVRNKEFTHEDTKYIGAEFNIILYKN